MPTRGPAGSALRAVLTALRPTSGAEFARLRRISAPLDARESHPLVVGVASVGAPAGASTLAALVARRLERLAPGAVAVLDGDGVRQPQRVLLGAGPDGGLRQLLADPDAHHQRRRIDPYVLPASVPLLAGATAEAGRAFTDRELELALTVLRHRYPIVVVDVPHTPSEQYLTWLAGRAGHLLAVAPAGTVAVGQLRQFLAASQVQASLVVSSVQRPADVMRAVDPGGARAVSGELRWPDDPALRRPSSVGLAELPVRTQIVVDTVVSAAVAGWPQRVQRVQKVQRAGTSS